jgi:hypothetical protein
MLEGPDAKTSRVAAASLGEAYAGSGDDELVAAIRAARVQHGVADQYAEALSRISGAEADAAAEADLDAQGPMTGMRVQWRTRGLTLEGSLTRLMEVGALPEGPGAAALAEESRRSFREIWPDREQDPADLLLHALMQAGVLRGFDTEADVIPPPHDELILGLSPPSDGAFAVQAARQSWNLPPDVGEGDWPDDEPMEQSDYTVEFLQDGRLFSFRAAFFRDWYDAGSVVLALNYALRKAGRPERFHPLETDGQATTLLFLTPAAATIARKELFLPIGEAPEIADKQGRGRG